MSRRGRWLKLVLRWSHLSNPNTMQVLPLVRHTAGVGAMQTRKSGILTEDSGGSTCPLFEWFNGYRYNLKLHMYIHIHMHIHTHACKQPYNQTYWQVPGSMTSPCAEMHEARGQELLMTHADTTCAFASHQVPQHKPYSWNPPM